ncbi:MAG: IPT/TIG domain-containing protein [Saprospirales bacterium]|nr:IPT/TIG domain-containing protein [Saprospirales bacterium]
MPNIFKLTWLLCLLLVAIAFNGCKKDDGPSDDIALNSFGPSPVLRGGDLRFIGENLDKVTAIILADNVEVNTFKSKSADLIVITVPDATVNGKVTLRTPQGDITTKTPLTISEPITLTAFNPAKARPGEKIALEGTYLNLIEEVIFANKKSVARSAFVSQSKTKIEVNVPDDAQTGLIVLSNGLADPILVESASALEVTLPVVTQLSPTPVKAGSTLTIEGADLDLTKSVAFNGGAKVTAFTSQTAAKIELTVPANAKDGNLRLAVASLVEVTTTQAVEMKVPSISGIAPNPAKNGGDITVTGDDLDLVTGATFGGGKTGVLQGGTATQISIMVPDDASSGALTLHTASGKSVTSGAVLDMVKPVVSGMAPLDIQFTKELTITGNHLDLVANVKFSGGTEATPTSASLNEVKVNIPVGTASGVITLVAKNGDEVPSAQSLNILPSTSATITAMPIQAKPGELINIEGVNLDEVTEVVFPGNVAATMYGLKSAALIQVVVPINAKKGVGTLTLITVNNEQIISPPINIQGVDPVADPALVFFNFDNLGLWWGDTGGPENDPALTLDGSNYYRANKDCNGWTGFFWRNGANNFPGAIIGTNVANYNLKFDVNVLEPITGGEFAWRLKGSSGDFWYRWKPWESSGSYKTDGWITVSVPLTAFSDGANSIADLNTITEDFGVAFNAGASKVNVCIDNVRFELK